MRTKFLSSSLRSIFTARRILKNQGWRCLAFVLAFSSLGSTHLLAQGAGYWHTSGNQILDSNNEPVRIAGINWYGFETTNYVANGLWAQDYKSILNTIKDNGYNVIRLPFSNQVVESPQIPGSINYGNGMNSDLAGLNSLQIMDKIVGYAGSIGLRVILDNHRSEAGNSAEQSGLWYTSAYPESAWLNDWSTMVNRYQGFTDASGNPTVIGVDLRNEPHNATSGGSCWGCGTLTNDWRLAAERAGNEVQGINPHLLIFVEGTDCYNGDCDWWGGNLEGAATYPVQLNTANQLVYSAHEYGPALFQQTWFNSSTTYSSLVANWTKFWAYLSLNDVAPVWVGEFGTDNTSTDIENTTPGSQGQWFQSLVTFLQNTPQINWTYWALNGEDSYALLDSNYDPTPVSALKQQLLASIQFSLNGGGGTGGTGGGGSTAPAAPTGLTASATSSSQINLTWTASTTSGVTYSVVRNGTTIASKLTTTSYSDTGLTASTAYSYVVDAVDAGGTTASNTASATTQAAASGGGGSACTATYANTNDWGTGFQAALSITNHGSAATSSWTMTWTFAGNQQLSGLWNGVASQSGETVTVTNESYNGSIGAGATLSGIGFTANYSGSNPSPTVSVSCH